MIAALSHTQGTLLTVAIIVVLVLLLGVVLFTDDLNWFD